MINVSQSTQENNLIKLSKEVKTKTNHIKEYLKKKIFLNVFRTYQNLFYFLK